MQAQNKQGAVATRQVGKPAQVRAKNIFSGWGQQTWEMGMWFLDASI